MFHIKQIFKNIALGASLLAATTMQAEAGLGALLDLTLGTPVVETGLGASVCTYNSTTQTLTIEAPALTVTFDAVPTIGFVFEPGGSGALFGDLVLTANIDNAGNLLGGTFTVDGLVTGPGCMPDCGPSLLSGTIEDYGIVDTGGTNDQADFRLDAMSASGDLLALFPPGDVIGVNVTLEGSTFGGDFISDFSCVSPKAFAGSTTPPEVVQGCELTIAKTVMPMTVSGNSKHWGGGHGHKGWDSDTDSDSGRDHNHNGDTDDSDSDSEVDSEDSSANSPVCGCKGRIKELTMRWDAPYAETVMVQNNRGVVLFATTLVQPGEEFTFPVNGRFIKFFANGQKVAKTKTGCRRKTGIGTKFGNFEVVGGFSKWAPNTPLCPASGTTCGTSNEVTYTYTVTNNGPGTANNVVIDDDRLGVVDSFVNNPGLVVMAPGASVTVTETACIFDTTVNVAVATGNDDNAEACSFNIDADGDGNQDNTATVTEDDGGHSGGHYHGCGHYGGGRGHRRWGGWWRNHDW